MLRHTVLFSRSRVPFAISSHSAANRRNRSDVSMGRPPCWSRYLRKAMQSPPNGSGPTLPKCYAAHCALGRAASPRCGGTTGVCRSSAPFINYFVARVEQSETRERQPSRTFVPGFRCAQSGLRNFIYFFVARMERSVIRGSGASGNVVPGLRCAPSGLRNQERRSKDRPTPALPWTGPVSRFT